MKHLVKHDVLDHKAWHSRMIEDAADDDGVVGRVVVSQTIARVVSAPGELRASHQAVEEAAVQIFKDFFQMILMTGGGLDLFSSADLADEACLSRDVMAGDIAAIARAPGAVNRPAVELG